MNASAGSVLRFSKMHGAGNDFLIFDRRDGRDWPSADTLRQLADRHFGIGCDQIISIEADRDGHPGYDIRNCDGSPAAQCGNGARCVAAWLWRDGAVDTREFVMHSPAGLVPTTRDDDGRFEVVLGVPDFDPASLPMVDPDAPAVFEVGDREWTYRVCSMGNPHALIEVEKLDATDVTGIGSTLQHSGRFPEGVNVGFAEVLGDDHIRLVVNERGAGVTLACGSGACAAAALLIRTGRVHSPLRIDMPGGTLQVRWNGGGEPVALAGPATFVFEGEVPA
ncbi:MAG TPA: diaminopimelate epimerase [Xanthomonadaceae bacterium]|nr:diaminopimelate epimerase [Xanthomonadaceae bacterium]